MRKLFLTLVGVLLLFAVPVQAQDEYPAVEAYGGYNYMRADISKDVADLIGVSRHRTAHGFLLGLVGNPHRNFGIEGEFSGHWFDVTIPAAVAMTPDDVTVDFRHLLFMAGPRIAGRWERATPWAHTLLGFAHTRGSVSGVGSDSNTNFAWAIGGGVDVNASRNVAVRLIQVDYILIKFDVDEVAGFPVDGSRNLHNFRIAFGIVIKAAHR
ncbi:MAG: porin family protein [Acidobacteria bacterium]|nr:porin family protein [Acidobacteriota bacterium]